MYTRIAGTMLLMSLAACGDNGYGGGYSAGAGVGPGGYYGTSPGGASDATLSVSVTNYDPVDYALWIQWQDNLGNVQQEFLVILPAAPPGSFSPISQTWPAVSGFSYSLVLLDPSGGYVDSAFLGCLSPGDFLPVSFVVVGGVLQ